MTCRWRVHSVAVGPLLRVDLCDFLVMLTGSYFEWLMAGWIAVQSPNKKVFGAGTYCFGATEIGATTRALYRFLAE